MNEEQVSDVIDGKCVLGPPQDIREVQNAYEAYEIMSKLNPYSVKDLLKAHKIMMEDLVKEAGVFRSKGVGVYAGDQLIHAGTSANYVPDLVGQLFDWLKKSKLHPLVKVFFASPFWKKLQHKNGQPCMSKKDNVATGPPS